jgi:hypothetical protein
MGLLFVSSKLDSIKISKIKQIMQTIINKMRRSNEIAQQK